MLVQDKYVLLECTWLDLDGAYSEPPVLEHQQRIDEFEEHVECNLNVKAEVSQTSHLAIMAC